MSTPVVPGKDSEFDRVSGQVVEASTQNAMQWNIPAHELTPLLFEPFEQAVDSGTFPRMN